MYLLSSDKNGRKLNNSSYDEILVCKKREKSSKEKIGHSLKIKNGKCQ